MAAEVCIDPVRWYTAREAEPLLELKAEAIKGHLRKTGDRFHAEKRGARPQWYIQGRGVVKYRKAWKLPPLPVCS